MYIFTVAVQLLYLSVSFLANKRVHYCQAWPVYKISNVVHYVAESRRISKASRQLDSDEQLNYMYNSRARTATMNRPFSM